MSKRKRQTTVARLVIYVEKTPRGWKRITEARYRKLKPARNWAEMPEPWRAVNSADYHDTDHDPVG